MRLKIRCDWESWKVFGFWEEVNKALYYGLFVVFGFYGLFVLVEVLFSSEKFLDLATVVFSFYLVISI